MSFQNLSTGKKGEAGVSENQRAGPAAPPPPPPPPQRPLQQLIQYIYIHNGGWDETLAFRWMRCEGCEGWDGMYAVVDGSVNTTSQQHHQLLKSAGHRLLQCARQTASCVYIHYCLNNCSISNSPLVANLEVY